MLAVWPVHSRLLAFQTRAVRPDHSQVIHLCPRGKIRRVQVERGLSDDFRRILGTNERKVRGIVHDIAPLEILHIDMVGEVIDD